MKVELIVKGCEQVEKFQRIRREARKRGGNPANFILELASEALEEREGRVVRIDLDKLEALADMVRPVFNTVVSQVQSIAKALEGEQIEQLAELYGLERKPDESDLELLERVATAKKRAEQSEPQGMRLKGEPDGWEEDHTLEECNCGRPRCNICRGGLTTCEVCGGAEGSLPTDCPGYALSRAERTAILEGRVDFESGEWFNLQEGGG